MRKKLSVLLSIVLIITIGLIGCSKKETVMKDREGNKVALPKKMDRIISTAPSNTEVLVELGLAEKLVAVDTYSGDVKGIPSDVEKIDFSAPDAEAIIALEPDVIIASGHNKTGNSKDPFEVIKEAGISVFYIPSSNSIQGIYDDIMFMADITNTKPKGEEIVNNMKSEVEKISEIGKIIKDKKKVYFEIGPAPSLYSFGNETFLNEMIELVGGENIFKDQKGWLNPSEEAVLDANPDIILTNVNYVDKPVESIKSRPGWENINAVKNNQVYSISTNPSSRPSQHIVTALKEIAVAVHPEKYGEK
ncbi:ABC transporter substrate-binding protein [Romboutsia sp.]|uniref:ABC transporter substrate-binding protein n=1 Tax=Romboutsia sp. TaxID=1965302 RepID=UPI003F2FB6B0